MKETDAVRRIFEELGLAYEHSKIEEGFEYFDVALEEDEEEPQLTALLLLADDEALLRLLLFVDELVEEEPLEQLTLLMGLNGELTTGAFCMDPEELAVYATVALPVSELNAAVTQQLIEALLFARDFYYDEQYPTENGDLAES